MKAVIFRLFVGLAFAGVLGASASSGQSEDLQKRKEPAKGNSEHTEWLARSLREMETIKPGMTRADLLKVFQEEGGLSTRSQRTYVFRGSPYLKVDVTFEAVGAPQDKLTQSPKDRITTISKPYLAWSISD